MRRAHKKSASRQVQDVRELLVARSKEAGKDEAPLDARSVLEHAACNSSSSSAITTLSRTALTLSTPSHLEEDDARIPLGVIAIAPSTAANKSALRPQRLNRLYLRPQAVTPVGHATASAGAPGAASCGPDSGGSLAAAASAPMTSAGAGVNSACVAGGTVRSSSSSGSVNSNSSSGAFRRGKRLAPINLRVATGPGASQHGAVGAGAATAVMPGSVEPPGDCLSALELLDEEVEQSVTVAADSDLLAETHGSAARRPGVPSLAQAASAAAAAITSPIGTNGTNATPPPGPAVRARQHNHAALGGAGGTHVPGRGPASASAPLPTAPLRSGGADADGPNSAGELRYPPSPAASLNNDNCSGPHASLGRWTLEPSRPRAVEGGHVLTTAPSTPPLCEPLRETRDGEATSAHPLDMPRDHAEPPPGLACTAFAPRASRDSAAAAAAPTDAATSGGRSCRIHMKLHSSDPEKLLPGMLAPLAKLLLPKGWAIRNMAVRPGCLELTLEYTRLEDVACGNADDLGEDAATVGAATAVVSNSQVAELVGYLHRQGIVDPSREPSVAVQVNQQLRRVEWRGHGGGGGGDADGGRAPQAISRLTAPSSGVTSWCTDTAILDTESYQTAAAAAAVPAAAAAMAGGAGSLTPPTAGDWACHSVSPPGGVADFWLNTQPEVIPICVVMPGHAPYRACASDAAAAATATTPTTEQPSSSSVVLYVGTPRPGFHSCTVRCLGRFLPVEQLQHLSAAAACDAVAAATGIAPFQGLSSGSAGSGCWVGALPEIDWGSAAAAAAAAGAGGEVFILRVSGLPRYCALMQMELRIATAAESWSSSAVECLVTSNLQSSFGSLKQLLHNQHHRASAQTESPAAPPETPAKAAELPCADPAAALPLYGAPGFISAPAPVLLLRACATSDQEGSCFCHGACLCSLRVATGVGEELWGLRARIQACHAAAVSAPAAAPPAAADAAREFINDLGLLMDAVASSDRWQDDEAEPDAALQREYPSYSQELRRLLMRQLGLAGGTSAAAVTAAAVDIDGTAVPIRQQLADTAVTLLAGCLELALPYTARLVMSCATRRLWLCDAEALTAAVATESGDVAAAAAQLDALLRVTEPRLLFQGELAVGAAGGSGGCEAITAPVGVTSVTLPAEAAAAAWDCLLLGTPPVTSTSTTGRECQAKGTSATALAATPPRQQASAAAAAAAAWSDDGLGVHPRSGPRVTRPSLRTSLSASALQEDCLQGGRPCPGPESTDHCHLQQHQHQHQLLQQCRPAAQAAGPGPGPSSSPPFGLRPSSGPLEGWTAEFGLSHSGWVGNPLANWGEALSVPAPLTGALAAYSGPSAALLVHQSSGALATQQQDQEQKQKQHDQPMRYQRFSRLVAAAAAGKAAAHGAEALAAATPWLVDVSSHGSGRAAAVATTATELSSHSSPIPGTMSLAARPDLPPPRQQRQQVYEIGSVTKLQEREAEAVQVAEAVAGSPSGTAASGGMENRTSVAEAPTAPPTLLQQFLDQVVVSFTGFDSPHLEREFWVDTAARLQGMCCLYAAITLVFVSLTVVRAVYEDGAATGAFMALYQGGQALLLGAYSALGDNRPERLFATVAVCTGLRAVCHALLSRGLAPLPSFVLPIARLWVDVFNEGIAKAVFEQSPAWLVFTLLVFLELPTSYALMSALDGHGRGLLTRCLPLRLGCLAALKTAVVLGTQAAWRVKFLARRRNLHMKIE